MIVTLTRILSVVAMMLLAALPARANDDVLRVYLDADFTVSYKVGGAIASGIRTALQEVDFQVGGSRIQIVDRNHKGRVNRSFANMEGFLNDDQALVMFGGMHSPPYLKYKDFINENGILTLLPWSAAGPITRASAGTENWIFRLSVDDSKAGSFLVDQAISRQGCDRLALLLLDTAWGRVNRDTMTNALSKHGLKPVYVKMLAPSIGEQAARVIISQLRQADADCAIILAQATEAGYLSHALYTQDHPLKLLSHWAILGARYPQTVGHNVRRFIGLQVLQSCGLRFERDHSPVLARALRGVGPRFERLSEMPAPAGFVHGYDLARIFIAAAEQAAKTPAWSGPIEDKRAALKQALENLEQPVDGILKTYTRPFAPYGADAPDAHEALGINDLCMARYDKKNRLNHF